MIRVTVELVRFGIGTPVVLGTAEICNDGTGTASSGNYAAVFYDKAGRPWRRAEVSGFARKRRLAWHLLSLALGAALGPDTGDFGR